TVHVLEPKDFQNWLDGLYQAPKKTAAREQIPGEAHMTMADRGAHLFRSKSCYSCHSVDGSQKVGPTVKGLFGSNVPLAGGMMVAADENYMRESIMDPMAKIVKGYAPQMPTFRGMLSDEDVNDLIAYLKTLK